MNDELRKEIAAIVRDGRRQDANDRLLFDLSDTVDNIMGEIDSLTAENDRLKGTVETLDKLRADLVKILSPDPNGLPYVLEAIAPAVERLKMQREDFSSGMEQQTDARMKAESERATLLASFNDILEIARDLIEVVEVKADDPILEMCLSIKSYLNSYSAAIAKANKE